jgi:hypothetical protein
MLRLFISHRKKVTNDFVSFILENLCSLLSQKLIEFLIVQISLTRYFLRCDIKCSDNHEKKT